MKLCRIGNVGDEKPALIDNEVSELLTQPNNKNIDKQTKENFIFNITNNPFYSR